MIFHLSPFLFTTWTEYSEISLSAYLNCKSFHYNFALGSYWFTFIFLIYHHVWVVVITSSFPRFDVKHTPAFSFRRPPKPLHEHMSFLLYPPTTYMCRRCDKRWHANWTLRTDCAMENHILCKCVLVELKTFTFQALNDWNSFTR